MLFQLTPKIGEEFRRYF